MIAIVNWEIGKDDGCRLRRLSLTIKDIKGELAAYELAATAMSVISRTVLWKKSKRLSFPRTRKGKGKI